MLPIVKVDWRKSSPVASRVPAISRVVRVAASSRMIGPSTQVSVPASASVRPPSSRTPEGASIVAVAPGAISVRPVPFCCPPVHKNEPDSASVPAPFHEPADWVRLATGDGFTVSVTAIVPPERISVPWLWMLSTLVVPSVRWTVDPAPMQT